jgi:AcrR family transcriptional regulator
MAANRLQRHVRTTGESTRMATATGRSKTSKASTSDKPSQGQMLPEAVEEARRRIVQAAAEAFMKNGYGATSINDICLQLKATKGMIYHHFDSKAELFFAVHQRAMDINLGGMVPIARSDEPAGERLKAMIEEQLRLIILHFPYMCAARQGVELYLLGSTTPAERLILRKLIARRREFERLFRGVIEDGMRSGEFRSVDSDVANKSMLGVLNWFTVWYQPQREKAQDREKIISGIVDFIMSSLQSR